MKKSLLLFFLAAVTQISFSQNYSPFTPGLVKSFKMSQATYTVELSKDSTLLNGFHYHKMIMRYSWGDSAVTLLRKDQKGNEIYIDPISKLETVNFPAKPTKDFQWTSTDKAWSYLVFDTGTTFKTPEAKYSNCLIIKASQLTGRDTNKRAVYYNYYAPDIGYVGSKTEQGLMSWLVGMK